ncbi:MAG: hypothetical protein R3B07_06980 [Polyangiaceae bacterium]
MADPSVYTAPLPQTEKRKRILWGEGATLTDYQGALLTLDRFASYAADVGLTEQYADQLSEWRYYFEAYCAYLESDERYPSFEAYLDAHPMDE